MKEQELKNWLNDPVTKYALGKLCDWKQERLQACLYPTDGVDVNIPVAEIRGINQVIVFLTDIHKEGEE